MCSSFRNRWAEKSVRLIHSQGYLDNLSSVYRVDEASRREVRPDLMRGIQEAYLRKDDKALIARLLKLDKFPFDDPYVSLLRKLPTDVSANPETVARIASRIRQMSWSQLEEAITVPKVANRQLGTRFSQWLATLGYPAVSESKLLRLTGGTAMLDGSEAEATEFARRHLGYEGEKRPDLLIKRGEKYIIGEAKFFTDHGGHQDRQFDDAMGLVNSQGSLNANATAVAILDGVVWIPGKSRMYRIISSTEHDVMSALLLPAYLESLT